MKYYFKIPPLTQVLSSFIKHQGNRQICGYIPVNYNKKMFYHLHTR
jgi:hypothetical protein